MGFNGWCLLALLGVGALGLALLTANPTVVYFCWADTWSRPERIGVNDADDFGRQHWTRCTNPRCWSRLCRYRWKRDVGSRPHRWADNVHWHRPPKLWTPFRRRHRVLYVTVPWRGLALVIERLAIRHYRSPFNVQHLARKHRHRSLGGRAA